MILTWRFPLIVQALASLRPAPASSMARPLLVAMTARRHLTGFATGAMTQTLPVRLDLIELDGHDLRREPLEVRKATLASVLAMASRGIRFNDHIHYDGEIVLRHACKMGLEGIVSKRKDSPYRSGRSSDWLKMKNPACEAVQREAEEDWRR
jgi:ATP-dependent DNA ligase